MNRHPGGEAQTLYLLENIEWKKEMKALDLGAGEGDTIRILKSLGMDAHGVDLFPRGSDVETGDFLHLQYPSDSIDLCISPNDFRIRTVSPSPAPRSNAFISFFHSMFSRR